MHQKYTAKWCISCGIGKYKCSVMFHNNRCGYWTGSKFVPADEGVSTEVPLSCASGCNKKYLMDRHKVYSRARFARKLGEGRLEIYCVDCAGEPIAQALAQGMDKARELAPQCGKRSDKCSRGSGMVWHQKGSKLKQLCCQLHSQKSKRRKSRAPPVPSQPAEAPRVEPLFTPATSPSLSPSRDTANDEDAPDEALFAAAYADQDDDWMIGEGVALDSDDAADFTRSLRGPKRIRVEELAAGRSPKRNRVCATVVSSSSSESGSDDLSDCAWQAVFR